ncbi:MAG: hypothetical protein HRU15_15040, partial [Planctomycetes bacterium]|nr:hypothetical protein [Planctomycetota bacterium]
TTDFTAANSSAQAISESIADPEPVCQGILEKMPFFNYRENRYHYVRWVSSPYSNKPSEYFNWTVGVPYASEKKNSALIPLELNLHRDGYSYWRSAQRMEYQSIVISPHDFPIKSWWYGYHEALGTLRSWKNGRVHNYTEKRLLSFTKWVSKKWPVDNNRVLVIGYKGGAAGSGALHMGIRYPKLFSLIISGSGKARLHNLPQGMSELEAIWGKVEWKLTGENGKAIYQEMDMVAQAEQTSTKINMPYLSLSDDGKDKNLFDLYSAYLKKGWPLTGHWAHGGAIYIPVSATSTMHHAIRVDHGKDRPQIIVQNASVLAAAQGNHQRRELRIPEWRNIEDQADHCSFTFAGGGTQLTITIRQLQKFKITKGKKYAYTFTWLHNMNPKTSGTPAALSGISEAHENGVLTITVPQLPQWKCTLSVREK